MRASHQTAIHHSVGNFRMKLQCVAGAMAKCLHGEGIAFSQQLTADRKVEAFAMPLIDMIGPVRTNLASGLCWPDRIIANLGVAVRVWKNTGAQLARQHLCAKTDTEIWFFVAKRDLDPVDLAAHELFIVVGALGSAKNDSAGVIVHRVRQRVAEARPPDVKRMTELRQSLPDAAWRRMLLVKNKKDWLQHVIRQGIAAD